MNKQMHEFFKRWLLHEAERMSDSPTQRAEVLKIMRESLDELIRERGEA